jgi:cytidylate kinase
VFRIITVEREYGCGGAAIAQKLAQHLKWKLWDQSLTQEIADLAHVDCSAVERHNERLDSRLYRLGKVFWRGSYERAIPLDASATFDADCMVAMMEKISDKIAREGNAVIVGRGAPYFLRGRSDTFHVFLYAPHEEKIRRLLAGGLNESEAHELVETVDRERIAYVKHYFGTDWPTRSLYHLMINTSIGDSNVIATILEAMRRLESRGNPSVTEIRGVK